MIKVLSGVVAIPVYSFLKTHLTVNLRSGASLHVNHILHIFKGANLWVDRRAFYRRTALQRLRGKKSTAKWFINYLLDV